MGTIVHLVAVATVVAASNPVSQAKPSIMAVAAVAADTHHHQVAREAMAVEVMVTVLLPVPRARQILVAVEVAEGLVFRLLVITEDLEL